MAPKKMSLKLVVDKEKNRVVFAESGSDFVDVLLSFLTMPIGTVMRLTGKESKIGGMSRLYESVEGLDVKILQTEACKKMLLKPKSASEDHCRNLKVNVDDTEPTKYYSCSLGSCPKGYNYLSTSCNSQCLCGKSTSEQIVCNEKLNVGSYSNDGVFVKGNMTFIIRDHLEVFPASMTATFTLLNEFGISDASVLEERSVNVGAAEVMSLLKRILHSKTPLTDVFLREQDMIDRENHDFKANTYHLKDFYQPQVEKGNGSSYSRQISVKLSVNKTNNKVVYAECGEEFADLLFSFLVFPLGVVTKLFGGDSGIRCLDNLYKSDLVLKHFMKSEESKGFLAHPILKHFFSCSNQSLQIRERQLRYSTYIDSLMKQASTLVTELAGSFIAGPAIFLVTDDLNVKQHSPMLGISLLTNLNIPISDLEVHVFSVGKKEVKQNNPSLVTSFCICNKATGKFSGCQGAGDANRPRHSCPLSVSIWSVPDFQYSIEVWTLDCLSNLAHLTYDKGNRAVNLLRARLKDVWSITVLLIPSLLMASMISKTVLTDVFYPKKPKDSEKLKTEV